VGLVCPRPTVEIAAADSKRIVTAEIFTAGPHEMYSVRFGIEDRHLQQPLVTVWC